MQYIITPYHLFAAATLVFILAGLFCGYVRSRHLCHPFDEDADYYYPARRQVTFFCVATALQLPYLLDPADADTWLYIRIFGVLYYPMCFSILLRRYFRNSHSVFDKLDRIGLYVAFLILLVTLTVVFIPSSDILALYATPLLFLGGAVGIFMTVCVAQMVHWLKRKIDDYHRSQFSNDEDFPFKLAKAALIAVLVWIGMMWGIFFTGNPWVKFACDLICSLWMTHFLTIILHPQFAQRTIAAAEEEGCTDEAVSPTAREMVLRVMLQKYLNPHLQKPEVMEAIPKGMKREANAFIAEVGYYNLVNMFRLQHAQLYRNSKPSATQEDIAHASGFTTRFAFYRARQNVHFIDPELVSRVTLDTLPTS